MIKQILLPIVWILDAIIWLIRPRMFIINPKKLTKEDKDFFTYLHANVKKITFNDPISILGLTQAITSKKG